MAFTRLHLLILTFLLSIGGHAFAKSSNNPFAKTIDVHSNSSWTIGEGEASQSAKSSTGDWYHLHYDGMRLRLRITNSADDSTASANSYDELAINDVQIDGKRVDIFQWCLNNQTRHNRFLQQGQSVKKNICQNQGEKGTFIMRMSKETIAQMNSGKELTIELKPFRTPVRATFSLSDFSNVNAEFKAQIAASKAAEAAAAAAAAAAVPVAAAPAARKAPEICKEKPPAGYSGIKPIEYPCDDSAAKARAASDMTAKVQAIKEEEARKAALLAKQKREAEAARLKREQELAREQAAIAASKAKQEAIMSEIAEKMIGVCQKKWAAGEHRCYCEKYIEHAPAGISPDPSCSSGS